MKCELSAGCKDFPINEQRLIRLAVAKAKESHANPCRVRLDGRFDEELARVIRPGGRLVIGRDDIGRAVVE